MKNIWEGSVRGEGALRDFKPLHASLGLRSGWAVQIMNRVHQKKALRAIGTTLENATLNHEFLSDDEEATFYSHSRESYVKYRDHHDVHYDSYYDKPLSLVYDGDNYGAMMRDESVVKFVCDTETEAVTAKQMVFRCWKPAFDPVNIATEGMVILQTFTVVYSCVLLPLPSNTSHQSFYAAVREDYKMMDATGNFV